MADLYGLTPRQWYRLQQMLAAYERGELRGGGMQPQRSGKIWPVEFGKATSAIAGVTAIGGNPVSGTVNLYRFNSTGNTTDSGDDATAYNLSSVTATTDTWLMPLYNERSGQYIIPPLPALVEFGKPDTAIAGITSIGGAPTSGTVSVYAITSTGGTTDTGTNVTAYNLSTVAVTTTQWVQLALNARSGQYIIHGTLEGRKVKDLVKITLSTSLSTGDATKTVAVSSQYGLGLDASMSFSAGNDLGLFSGSTGKTGYAMPSSSSGGPIIQMQCT